MPDNIAQLLESYLAQPVRPFDWRHANCCHWVAGWVQHATGRNPMQGLTATPTALSAQRLVKRLGGSLASAWSRQLGCAPQPVALAKRGDLVLFHVAEGVCGELATGSAMGLCVGSSAAIAISTGAVVFVPMSAADLSWPINPNHPATC